jgi:hypothetical protein
MISYSAPLTRAAGCGESGKSTFFKQLRFIQGQLPDEERARWKSTVYANIITQMKLLVAKAIEEELHFENPAALVSYP